MKYYVIRTGDKDTQRIIVRATTDYERAAMDACVGALDPDRYTWYTADQWIRYHVYYTDIPVVTASDYLAYRRREGV